jgi:hypothetical protein
LGVNPDPQKIETRWDLMLQNQLGFDAPKPNVFWGPGASAFVDWISKDWQHQLLPGLERYKFNTL